MHCGKPSCNRQEATASDELSGDANLKFQTTISMAITRFPSETKRDWLALQRLCWQSCRDMFPALKLASSICRGET
jgi:hypothetical protein